MSMDASSWAAIVSWLGVVVTFIFSWRAHAASKEANEIQRQIADIQADAHRWNLQQRSEANWYFSMQKSYLGRHELTVTNTGPGEARSVKAFVNEHPVQQSSTGRREPPGEYEVSLLSAGAAACFHVHVGVYESLSGVPASVKVTWLDDAGQERSFETKVTSTR